MRWTSEAERWLREIHDYIARDDPAAALRTVRGIYDRAEQLAEFPEIGHRYQGRPDAAVRILLYGHYRIAYSNGFSSDLPDDTDRPSHPPTQKDPGERW